MTASANFAIGYDQNDQETTIDQRDDHGSILRTSISYDAYGRIDGRWRPYPLLAAGNFQNLPHSAYSYDILGRLLTESFPPSKHVCSYQSNTTRCSTLTGPNVAGADPATVGFGQPPPVDWAADETVHDQFGRVVTRTEWVGQATGTPHRVTTSYVYGQFGLVRDVFDTNSNKTELTYDIRGRRQTISDLDTGLQTDTYDAFDQLFQTAVPTGTVTMGYDPLGRKISETTTEAPSNPSTFDWDHALHGIGKLTYHSSSDGVRVDLEYDDHGRPSTQTWDLPTAGSKKRLDLAYDPVLGRLQSITYPTVGTTRYQAQFTYTQSSGELASVLDGSGALLWRADARNAERNLTLETFGDGARTVRTYEPMRGFLESIGTNNGATPLRNLGFIYDERGLMKTRANYVGGDSETFTHDELDRLVHWGSESAGWSVDYAYDDIGNMTTRASAQPGQSETKTFTTGGPRPHALTSVADDSYGYDRAGRQTTGPSRIVTYTDFNLPRTIKKDGINWSFQHDANHSRAVKQKESGDTTFYFGGFYELRSPQRPYLRRSGAAVRSRAVQAEVALPRLLNR